MQHVDQSASFVQFESFSWLVDIPRMCKLYMNFSFGSLELRECFVPVLLSLSVC